MKVNDLTPSPTVFVIDDDQPMRDSVSFLLRAVGLQVGAFASPDEFLRSTLPNGPSCLVLDVRFPGISGLNLQDQLAKADIDIPIIFMTGHGDIPMSVQAMKAGAIAFLTKPFRDYELLEAVQIGLERARVQHEKDKALSTAKTSLGSLNPREREVFALVSAGQMNKQIAGQLGLSEVTVKVHRGNVMRKMGVKNVPELVRMADALLLS